MNSQPCLCGSQSMQFPAPVPPVDLVESSPCLGGYWSPYNLVVLKRESNVFVGAAAFPAQECNCGAWD